MNTPLTLDYDTFTGRPPIMGRWAMVSSGHSLASLAGLRILEKGGNAVDAGVATGLCLNVLQSDFVNFGGVAPIIIYLAESGETVTISGLGTWPEQASCEYFLQNYDRDIPDGVLQSLVPSAPDAWITALREYGTMTFSEVAETAIDLADSGFPMHRFMSNTIKEHQQEFGRWPSLATIYLPQGRPPEPGELFFQRDLASTLRKMVAQEDRCRLQGRRAALTAARDEFYQGEIAHAISTFYAQEGGLVTSEDLAGFHVQVEKPVATTYRDYTIYGCGAWCQGPVLLQVLNILEGCDLASLGHNSTDYIHLLLETLKLAFADRHAFYGDPAFVDVPLEGLLNKGYAAERRALIRRGKAWPEMPPAGDPWPYMGRHGGLSRPGIEAALTDPRQRSHADTTYLCVVDRHGNAFSATPSDAAFLAPVVPGTGLVVSTRGGQSWVDPDHPSSIQPGKRPRLTPNPAIVLRNGKLFMTLGTPGGDVQCQAMAQCFLNIVEFGMNPQQAVEAPRFATFSFPATSHPHAYAPGQASIESRVSETTRRRLAQMGHRTVDWSPWSWKAGGVCTIVADHEQGVLIGGADPRRESYAVGR
jgi:gamma-glutamyltranspeptidase/glutathione hydrolase